MKIISFVEKGDMLKIKTDDPNNLEFVYFKDKFKNIEQMKKEIEKKIEEIVKKKEQKEKKIKKIKEELDKEIEGYNAGN